MNDDSGRMVAAMDAYIAELETQGAPDHEAFLARYPEIADRLRPCLNALGFMHGA